MQLTWPNPAPTQATPGEVPAGKKIILRRPARWLSVVVNMVTPAMPNPQAQAKILAQGIYEIRILLSGYLGGQNAGDPTVRLAAHLAYALHNEALAVIGNGTFDAAQALAKVRAVDRMFEENLASRFEPHVSNQG